MSDSSDTDSPLVAQKKGKEKEVTVVQDQGFFTHSTGDTYDGFFEAKKKDKSVRMHGPGIYTTAEGDIYAGMWESDKFGGTGADEVTITYTDGSKYEGFIKDWSYQGPGKYTYPDLSVLTCDFSENCPVGKLRLTDPNGHVWLGRADSGMAWFQPVNHFYNMLEKVRETPKVKRRRKTTAVAPLPPPEPEKKKVQLKT